jgi:hypothetical protein
MGHEHATPNTKNQSNRWKRELDAEEIKTIGSALLG